MFLDNHWEGIKMSLPDKSCLAEILKRSNEIIIVLNDKDKISYINPAFMHCLGYDYTDVIGCNIGFLNDNFKYFIETARKDGRIKRQVKLNKNANDTPSSGKILVHLEVIVLEDPNSKEDSILIVARNITELELLRRKLADFQRMDTIVQLVQGVAHELNRELTLMYAMLEAVYGDIQATDIRELVSSASSACLRAANTVKNLQALGNRNPASTETVFVYRTINDIIAGYSNFLFQGVEISFNCLDRSIKAEIDPQKLQQVILNILINAKEALIGIKNPKITINIGMAKITGVCTGSTKDKYVVIEIQDNGIGMNKDLRERIFEPHFSTKSPDNRGMGLHVSRDIIKQHRGWVSVESLPHYGSKFSIHLPATDKTSTQEIEGLKNIPEGHETLLYFEENANLQRRIQGLIEKFGYTVIPVNLLGDVYDTYREHRNDVSVLIFSLWSDHDIYIDALRKITAENPDIKVLVITDYISDEITSAFGENALEYPYSSNQLLIQVRKILDL